MVRRTAEKVKQNPQTPQTGDLPNWPTPEDARHNTDKDFLAYIANYRLDDLKSAARIIRERQQQIKAAIADDLQPEKKNLEEALEDYHDAKNRYLGKQKSLTDKWVIADSSVERK